MDSTIPIPHVEAWAAGEAQTDLFLSCRLLQLPQQLIINKATKGGKRDRLDVGGRNGLGGWYYVVGTNRSDLIGQRNTWWKPEAWTSPHP